MGDLQRAEHRGVLEPPDPTGYAHLLRGAYAAVKEVDPSATVVVGGLAAAGTYESDPVRNPVRFVEAMYLAGAQGSFDAIGIHPGGNTLPSTVSIPTTWYQLHGDALDGGMVGDPPTPSLRRLMIDHGDEDKEIWLTHFGRTTVGTGSIDEAAQALTVRDAYFTWSTYPWAGPLFWFAYRDEGGDTTQSYLWFGLVHQDRTHKPAWDAYSELARATRAWRSP